MPETIVPSFSRGVVEGADRIVVYGTGGIGKTTLCSYLPAPGFFDLERGTRKLDVQRDVVESWPELRSKVAGFADAPPSGARSIVIDTASIGEELAKEHVIATRLTEKGKRVDSIEGYGFGKGWQFVYDEFVALLADLDRVVDRGFNVCLIAHDVSTVVPNPTGEDYLRWEPFLYGGDKRGRANVRGLVKNWAEHVLFLGYDVAVEEGKASGSATRTIYTLELPTHIAKSRTRQLVQTFDLQSPGAVWQALGIR